MRHISLFEVLANRIEDLTGIPARRVSPVDFRPVEGPRKVTLEGRYQQISEADGHYEPNFWTSIDRPDEFLYNPDYLPEDEGRPDYSGGNGSGSVEGPVIW